MARPIFFLSDYGTSDPYLGVVRAVLARLAPESPVHDLGHALPAFDGEAARLHLAETAPWLPDGAVVLVAVDPGGARRPLALRAEAPDGRTVHGVGPEGAPFASWLAPARPPYGCDLRVAEAAIVERSRDPELPAGPGLGFDGRDRFAPAAARLARGEPLAVVGRPVDPSGLAAPEPPPLLRDGADVIGRIVRVDRFGNLISDLPARDAPPPPWRAELAGVRLDGPVALFSDVAPGTPALYAGSSGTIEVAVREGNAAVRFGVGRGAKLRVGPGSPGPARS